MCEIRRPKTLTRSRVKKFSRDNRRFFKGTVVGDYSAYSFATIAFNVFFSYTAGLHYR